MSTSTRASVLSADPLACGGIDGRVRTRYASAMRQLIATGLATSCLALACSAGTSSTATSSSTGDGGSGTGSSGALGDIGGTRATCAAVSSAGSASQACQDCQAANCKAQIQAQNGSDPSTFGGACQAFYACFCACPAVDGGSCALGCVGAASQPCRDAIKAVTECREAKCAASCKTDGG